MSDIGDPAAHLREALAAFTNGRWDVTQMSHQIDAELGATRAFAREVLRWLPYILTEIDMWRDGRTVTFR